MHVQVEKLKENKSCVIANSVVQKKSNVTQGFRFEDNRPEAVAQRKIQEVANQSPQPALVQRRPLNKVERENLADAQERFAKFQEYKSAMADALVQRGGFGNLLGYFQDLGWDHATEEISRLESMFSEMTDLSRRAVSNHKACRDFISKVNFFDKSGGMNRFFNIFKNVEKGLLSQERNFPTQYTEMDEIYFRKYMADSKSAITVYRGDGRNVTRESFDELPFATMPAGGTPDITFAGVVDHTHSNTKKNGMVSCTTDPSVAHHFATESHEYGVVWELKLDNYIHVTNLLKSRNFKYRFPGQFEILHPGPIPGGKIVSAKLYNKGNLIKTRTS